MKSHVSMEQKQCIVCGACFDSGAILLDRRLRQSLETKTVTGLGLCPTHDQPDFVHLIGCSNTPHAGDGMMPHDADRTGEIASVKVEAWQRIFNVPVPEGRVAFVEQAVIEMLKGRTEGATT